MGIDTNKLKAELRDRMVSLIESERGLASKLSKSIGKTGSYFSEIKRGCPVNALHIKAVGNIFGQDKVCEILGIPTNNLDSQNQPVIFADCTHAELIKEFQQKELAKECTKAMINLEKIDPEELKEVMDFIEYRISKKNQQEPKKTPEPTTWSGTERRKKAAS